MHLNFSLNSQENPCENWRETTVFFWTNRLIAHLGRNLCMKFCELHPSEGQTKSTRPKLHEFCSVAMGVAVGTRTGYLSQVHLSPSFSDSSSDFFLLASSEKNERSTSSSVASFFGGQRKSASSFFLIVVVPMLPVRLMMKQEAM